MRSQSDPTRRLSNLRSLAIFALLLLGVFLYAGCHGSTTNTPNTNDGNVPVNAQSNTSPQATPSPSPKASQEVGGDEPVVITGGSVDIDFNDATYQPDNPTNPTAWTCTGCKLNSVAVFDTNKGDPLPTLCPLPTGANPTVHIDAGGKKNDVTITGGTDARGNNTVTVKFDNALYGAEPGNPKKHKNKNNKIKQVTVQAGSGSPQQCPDVPPNGKCVIKINVSR